MHAADPVEALNVFAAHALNEPPSLSGPVYPTAADTQAVLAVEPAKLPELVGQAMHMSAVCVVSPLYFPAAQLVHAAAGAVAALNVPAMGKGKGKGG